MTEWEPRDGFWGRAWRKYGKGWISDNELEVWREQDEDPEAISGWGCRVEGQSIIDIQAYHAIQALLGPAIYFRGQHLYPVHLKGSAVQAYYNIYYPERGTLYQDAKGWRFHRSARSFPTSELAWEALSKGAFFWGRTWQPTGAGWNSDGVSLTLADSGTGWTATNLGSPEYGLGVTKEKALAALLGDPLQVFGVPWYPWRSSKYHFRGQCISLYDGRWLANSTQFSTPEEAVRFLAQSIMGRAMPALSEALQGIQSARQLCRDLGVDRD